MIFEIAFSARFKRSLADFLSEVAVASTLGAAAFTEAFGAFFADDLTAAFFEVAAGLAAFAEVFLEAFGAAFLVAFFAVAFFAAFGAAFFAVAFLAAFFTEVFADVLTAFFAIESSWKRLKYVSRDTKIVSYFGLDYQNSLCHAKSVLGSRIASVSKMRQKTDERTAQNERQNKIHLPGSAPVCSAESIASCQTFSQIMKVFYVSRDARRELRGNCCPHDITRL